MGVGGRTITENRPHPEGSVTIICNVFQLSMGIPIFMMKFTLRSGKLAVDRSSVRVDVDISKRWEGIA